MAGDEIAYNIIPLDDRDSTDAIFTLPEVQAAVAALKLKYCELLPKLPNDFPIPAKRDSDIFDLLQYTFGFQRGSVSNQREHVVHLLANAQSRHGIPSGNKPILDKAAVDEVFDKSVENYRKWSSHVGIQRAWTNLHLDKEEELLLLSLYFLIWGEAANVRFLPECLCYIFHRMARKMLDNLMNEHAEPTMESFLDEVITPLYDKVIAVEAKKNGDGKEPHSTWRNYDDLNECFWSIDPKKHDRPWDKNSPKSIMDILEATGSQRQGKQSFVECRTFLHLYHSFDRLWIFLVMMFQVLAIIAFNDGNFNSKMRRDILNLGPTFFVMKFIKIVLDVVMMYGTSPTKRRLAVCRICLMFCGALVIMHILYVKALHEESKQNSTSVIFILYVSFIGIHVGVDFSPSFSMTLQQNPSPINRFINWINQASLTSDRHDLLMKGSMPESASDVIKYMLFWLVVLSGKFLFAYFVLIKPSVKPTRAILDMRDLNIGSKSCHNVFIVASFWAPVVAFYLLDIYVFYSVISAFWGFVVGARHGLGQIIHLEDFHRFFKEFPEAFMKKLHVPIPNRNLPNSSSQDDVKDRKIAAARFAPFWNEVIRNLRLEDYLTDPEMRFLIMPKNSGNLPLVQWPPFLLTGKIFEALHMAENANSQDEVWEKISRDFYMKCAVEECYYALEFILTEIYDVKVKKWVRAIYKDIKASKKIQVDQLKKLSHVVERVTALIGILRKKETEPREDAIKAVLDLLNVVWSDFLSSDKRVYYENLSSNERNGGCLIKWPIDANLRTQVERLHLILTLEGSTANMPKNVEARSRLKFFINSLFMDLPEPKPVRQMKSFSVLTPYYSEDVLYRVKSFTTENEDRISIFSYLKRIFPDEWHNALARLGLTEKAIIFKSRFESFALTEEAREIELWVSYRGQTLARTVRGMMYYRKALMLQSYLESVASGDVDDAFFDDDAKVPRPYESSSQAQAQARADLKFTYVVSAQIYGKQKAERKPEADDIKLLMLRNKALRVAFIEEVEDKKDGKMQTKFYSKLVKAGIYGEDQEIYSIKLPGNPMIGEGKPENQNHAIIFTRGDAIQTIDMNQDNYFEEALKMRNLMEEFDHRDKEASTKRNLPEKSGRHRTPTILGVREHIYTGSASSLASFMSNQETSFVTLGQRIMANPLKVRMHYGHPDVFDRVFHITRGGISKASRGINISEDIFAGFNSTLRDGLITHHEYIQVGKGRDVGLNQITLFEGKVAGGNGEQVLSRDVYRLGQRLNFFRTISFYSTTAGYYFCNMLMVLTIYIFLYGRAYLALSGGGEQLHVRPKITKDTALSAVLSTQLLFQIGVFTAVPMFLGFFLEQGLLRAVVSFIVMQIQLCSVFFTFSLGTRAHYFGRAILHGGARYRATGREFVVHHVKFSENYGLYSRSHFVKGLEVVLLLVVDLAYGYNEGGASSLLLFTVGSWFMALSWLFAPCLFNPSGFEWQKTVEDFSDWTTWLRHQGGKGVDGQKSWKVWWGEELANIPTSEGRIVGTILSLRYFVLHYGILYKLHMDSASLQVYGFSGILLVVHIILLMVFTFREGTSASHQFRLRLLQLVCLSSALVGIAAVPVFTKLSFPDIFACILAFIPTGWGILSIAAAWKPWIEKMELWKSICSIAWLYDAGMGMLIFIPTAFLSWFPFVSTFQSRLMFEQNFSRGLEASSLLSARD